MKYKVKIINVIFNRFCFKITKGNKYIAMVDTIPEVFEIINKSSKYNHSEKAVKNGLIGKIS